MASLMMPFVMCSFLLAVLKYNKNSGSSVHDNELKLFSCSYTQTCEMTNILVNLLQIFASDSFLELTEYAREEILGRNCR